MAYDWGPDNDDDAEALRTRRSALRAFAEEVADIVRALPMPQSYLEAERAVRAVTVADRLIVRLPAPGEVAGFVSADEDDPNSDEVSDPVRRACPQRLGLRDQADRIMDAATRIPKPETWLEGERAGRYALAAERMLTQLYAPPKPSKPDFEDDDDGFGGGYGREPATLEEWQALLGYKIDYVRRREAERSGHWGDGAAWDDNDPDHGVIYPYMYVEGFDPEQAPSFNLKVAACWLPGWLRTPAPTGPGSQWRPEHGRKFRPPEDVAPEDEPP